MRVFHFITTTCITLAVALLISACNEKNDTTVAAESLLTWVEWNNTANDTTVYFLSPDGSDDNPGTEISLPLRTLEEAFSRVHSGGKIRVLPGTYSFAIALQYCRPSQEIVIEGFHGTPVFDGKGLFPMGLFLENCSNLTITNIEARNYTDLAIGGSQCKNIHFDKLFLYDNGHAPQLGWEFEGYGLHVENSEDIEISDCETFRNGPNPQIFPNLLMGTGINTFSLKNSVIRNNISHHNTGGGFLIEDGVNILFENNEAYENDLDASQDGWWDGGLWLDGGSDITIRNNFFHDNLGPGIEISDEENQQPKGYVLENNVSNNNYYGIFIWNFGTSQWPDSSILKHSGNTFSPNSRKDIWIIP